MGYRHAATALATAFQARGNAMESQIADMGAMNRTVLGIQGQKQQQQGPTLAAPRPSKGSGTCAFPANPRSCHGDAPTMSAAVSEAICSHSTALTK